MWYVNFFTFCLFEGNFGAPFFQKRTLMRRRRTFLRYAFLREVLVPLSSNMCPFWKIGAQFFQVHQKLLFRIKYLVNKLNWFIFDSRWIFQKIIFLWIFQNKKQSWGRKLFKVGACLKVSKNMFFIQKNSFSINNDRNYTKLSWSDVWTLENTK